MLKINSISGFADITIWDSYQKPHLLGPCLGGWFDEDQCKFVARRLSDTLNDFIICLVLLMHCADKNCDAYLIWSCSCIDFAIVIM